MLIQKLCKHLKYISRLNCVRIAKPRFSGFEITFRFCDFAILIPNLNLGSVSSGYIDKMLVSRSKWRHCYLSTRNYYLVTIIIDCLDVNNIPHSYDPYSKFVSLSAWGPTSHDPPLWIKSFFRKRVITAFEKEVLILTNFCFCWCQPTWIIKGYPIESKLIVIHDLFIKYTYFNIVINN